MTVGAGSPRPLPHHRTYGSRIRRFGRWSQGETSPRPERLLPACQPRVHPRGRASFVPSPDAISPLHTRPRLSSTVRAFPPLRVVLCRLLTSARRSGRIPPPSVLHEDTPQISRGQRSYRPCIDAGLIKHSPVVDGGLHGRVPARPDCATPRLGFVSLAPPVRSMLPAAPLTVTPWRFPGPSAPRTPGPGTFTPKHDSMHGTHAGASAARGRPPRSGAGGRGGRARAAAARAGAASV